MKTSLVLLLGAGSLPVNRQVNEHRVARREDDTYGSWDWFINQIAQDNKEAKPTETPTRAPRRPNRRQPVGSHPATDDSRFNFFYREKEEKQAPIMLQQRSSNPGLVAGSVLSRGKNKNKKNQFAITNPSTTGAVQFIGQTADNAALMYNTFVGGSGDDDGNDRSITSFSAGGQSADYYSIYADEYEKNNLNSQNKFGQITFSSHNEEKGQNREYTFNTQVQNTHFDPWAAYTQTRVNDGDLLPVNLVNEWPSNDQTLGGAIFEVMNFVFGSTGTCYINLPVSVYWFHAFNAHIVPTKSDPATGVYAIVAANQAFEGISTLDFIVNFQSDDMRFDATQIELSCDSTETWISSIYSFPGNTVGDVGRTNVRRPNDGEGFFDKKVIVEFPYNVEEFHADDSRLTVTSGGADPTTGKTFTITGLSDTYLEEVWFSWNYISGGWFTAADTSVSIFEDDTN